jgi:hypothetical protein
MIPFTVTFLLPYQIKQITCVMSPEDIPELERNCFSIAKVRCSFGNRYNFWLCMGYLHGRNLLRGESFVRCH